MKQISDKRKAQMADELLIKEQIYRLGNGKCELCQNEPISDRGHEIIFRSQGGSPTDAYNIIQLCTKCHNREHGLDKEPPHDKEWLLACVKEIRDKQGFGKLDMSYEEMRELF